MCTSGAVIVCDVNIIKAAENLTQISSALQRKTAVTAYFSSEQLLLFAFASPAALLSAPGPLWWRWTTLYQDCGTFLARQVGPGHSFTDLYSLNVTPAPDLSACAIFARLGGICGLVRWRLGTLTKCLLDGISSVWITLSTGPNPCVATSVIKRNN